MSDKTGIAWTDATWNPVTGCSKVTEGCRHCYAERVWPRLAASPGRYFGREFGDVRIHPEVLEQPLRWNRHRRIFVNSMSDLFHPSVPDDFIDRVFAVMALAKQHTFQILTKRPERMKSYMDLSGDTRWAAIEKAMVMNDWKFNISDKFRDLDRGLFPPPNVWLGVSVEDQKTANERIPLLLETPSLFRWVSIEPMIGPVSFRWAPWHETYYEDPKLQPGYVRMNHLDGLRRIDWIVAGGESGPDARPMDAGWVRILAGECQEAGVPLFVKQLGAAYSDPLNGVAGAGLKVADAALPLVAVRLKHRSGADPAEWPQDLRVRELPKAKK